MSVVKFIFSKDFLKQIGLALVVVVILIGFIYVGLSFYTDHGESISVPNVKGMTLDQAMEEIEEKDLRPLVVDSIYGGGVAGTIHEQLPSPESQVKENRQIYLTINSFKPPMKKVKVKIGESFRIAETKLNIDGIDFEKEYRPDVCDDCVVAMLYKGKEIENGFKLRKGEKIKLILGERGNKQVLIPSLYGLDLNSAKSTLENASLTIGYPIYQNPEDTVGARIYQQTPAAENDNTARQGSEVTVWLTTDPLEYDSLNTNTPAD